VPEGDLRAVIPAALRSRSARHAGVFLGSRVINGALALVQVYLATRAVGSAESGRFFLLWTAAWLLAVVLMFGADGVLPRAVAEATVAGRSVVSMRRVLSAGALSGLVALPILMVLLDVPLEGVGLLLALGVTWAAILTLGSLLKAHGRPDLSGVTTNVFWPVGGALAPLPLLGPGGTWIGLAALTLLASAISLAATLAVTLRTLGAPPVLGLVGLRGVSVPVERDELGAAVLTSLHGLIVYLPVVLAALVGVPPAVAAGIFVATRVAGPFSWGYQAVVAVLTPRIAASFARDDMPGLRKTLLQGSIAGAALTWPLCLAGMLLAGPLLGLFDPAYREYTDVLVLLIAARAFDAATGPLGEALLVGRLTWLDVGLVMCGVVAGTVATVALYGDLGDLAIGVGAAGGFVIMNALRALALGRILSRGHGDVAPRLAGQPKRSRATTGS
jgi:O-antigen/teichoic acid export membrane protein